jgi:integrase
MMKVPSRALVRQVLGMAMRRGCQAAGLAPYSHTDLSHRYASVKVREGIPVRDLAAQLGHARKSMTLDTYLHVLRRTSTSERARRLLVLLRRDPGQPTGCVRAGKAPQ